MGGAQDYIDVLDAVPPQKALIHATVCQHIYARDLLLWFRALNITDLYLSRNLERRLNGVDQGASVFALPGTL
jgi:hypothetical protein